MGQARNDDERAFVERLYDEAMAEGPDFINYRGKRTSRWLLSKQR